MRRPIILAFVVILGGVLGWIASVIMGRRARFSVAVNVIVGIIGAVLSDYFVSPLVGADSILTNDFSASGLFLSLLGTSILLAVVNYSTRRTVKPLAKRRSQKKNDMRL